MRTKEEEAIANLRWREEKCWDMAEVFLQNRDAHGVMDMGAELQSLQRAINELEKLQNA